VVRIDLSVLLVIQSFICNKGGREVLGRTVVLRGSSGCLNTGSCSFHLVAARETRVAGWCKGEQVVLCYTGWSLCNWKLVLPSSWCWNTQGVGASF
jgi:hypothetical protein